MNFVYSSIASSIVPSDNPFFSTTFVATYLPTLLLEIQRRYSEGAHTHTHTFSREGEEIAKEDIAHSRGRYVLSSPRVELVGCGGDDGGESSTVQRRRKEITWPSHAHHGPVTQLLSRCPPWALLRLATAGWMHHRARIVSN